ncbi:unnamed protein product [Didymodactylos carnosus]|uniref:Tetratricopeptide repeat protein 8 n=1 Tax=Didymodactylos carnosus TaxID=1234261 RepID=A0A813PHM1_9BILA|nr:unnamed protein product [Didymodactylos carnosus]CAF0748971.1 unnamed protein product [Didymodactylos carnosus]CAF3526521.1 unnamed protein product [Didymodactylos carnosus]CAF3528199.1 unnamed protein product [Didymodactylos carnosus]
MRALTEQLYVDEVEAADDGLADLLDENAFANIPLPGTSMRQPTANPNATAGPTGPSPAMRPMTQSGRPITGMIRLNTQSTQGKSVENALKTARTSTAARPVTTSTGRFMRLGTASMLSSPDGPFIQVARLNFQKYAKSQALARPLFEHLFYHVNDIGSALQLARLANEATENKDWYWLVQLGKCYHRLGMFRDAEKNYLSALDIQPMVDIYLYISKVYTRLDQPLLAISKLTDGLTKFPQEPFLVQAMARIYEGLNDTINCMNQYRHVLKLDNTNVEAIACIAANYFYTDQPEISLKFYRRLLQIGCVNSAIFTNIGLCCFYSQQFDMVIACFLKALSCANEDIERSDIWFNIGEIALYTTEVNLAIQCFRLALVYNNDHAEAYNNLGLVELQRNNTDIGRAYLQTAQSLAPHMFEPQYNYAKSMHQQGDLQSSFRAIKSSLELYKNHADSKQIFDELTKMFAEL